MQARADAATLVPQEQLDAEMAAERAAGREPWLDFSRQRTRARPILTPRFKERASDD